jgi:hypothetical protein
MGNKGELLTKNKSGMAATEAFLILKKYVSIYIYEQLKSGRLGLSE